MDQCSKCEREIEEIGGHFFRTCKHLICLSCITELATLTEKRTIRCVLNKSNDKLVCGGFLNLEDLQWIIPEQVFEAFRNRVEQNANAANSPNETEMGRPGPYLKSSTELLEQKDTDGDSAALAMSEVAPEDTQSGWSQISQTIIDLQASGLSFEEANSHMDLIPIWITDNIHTNECPICLEDIEPSQGIILKGCFHVFCRECISNHVTHCDTAEVQCPFREDDYICTSVLTPKEVETLVSRPTYVKHYEEYSLLEAEKCSPDTFHCLTPNCTGFCFVDREVAGALFFRCPKCGERSCTACKVIHAGTCEAYRRQILEEERRIREFAEDESNRIVQRANEERSEMMIRSYINQRTFMQCPRCHIPCYKFTGCNHVVCGSCRFKFDWNGNQPGTSGFS
ncbi:ranBP-type and C3HC4-type zinc finger-containing protein 1 isoform X2 [Folsomia candida]|uniref:ranBP-type and C3HC4-type zinc finger-containing protein 1 isoform X2 n=1 Tax=Folsomia candida TaxID=158441 RepID=UPI000B903DC9|nr:ranBP-type and C3HC4-type zinc finger-containing protein 1 isoform X2 [Folsomia candida]XP_035704055.1 ranBP-type and C3HC4-type zinc finger-containing protein 1 isoform X2 [Folsomia candida]